MRDLTLPQGDAATRLPGVSFTLPGLFRFSDLIFECQRQVREKFAYQLPIRYLYGAPLVRWNCGRLLFVKHHDSLEEMERELQAVSDRGVTPLLTFSSPILRPEDLGDSVCNGLLEILNRLRGGAIIASSLLKDYIRRRYPNVSLHASVILTTFAPRRDAAYYQALSREYDHYVIHSDDKLDLALLEQLPRHNAEIILNERCVYQCPQRREHYVSIAEDQTALLDGAPLCDLSNFLARCPFVPEYKQKGTPQRSIALTAREAEEIAALGFRLFKLQGRLDSPYVFFFDFLHYALEGELAFPTMYPIFSYTIQNYLKERRKGTS